MRPEWFIELTRKDGGPVRAEEVAAAWRDPHVWAASLGVFLPKPIVEADGVVRAGRSVWRTVERTGKGPARSLLYRASRERGKGPTPHYSTYFDRLRAVGLAGQYRHEEVYRLREFAYSGPIPPPVARHAIPNAPRFAAGCYWAILMPSLAVLLYQLTSRKPEIPVVLIVPAVGVVLVVTIPAIRALGDALHRLRLQAPDCGWPFAVLERDQRAEKICWESIAARICHACGYDLRGSTGPRCPECGHPNLRWWCERDRLAESVEVVPSEKKGSG